MTSSCLCASSVQQRDLWLWRRRAIVLMFGQHDEGDRQLERCKRRHYCSYCLTSPSLLIVLCIHQKHYFLNAPGRDAHGPHFGFGEAQAASFKFLLRSLINRTSWGCLLH
jgi:hypothetical protein